MSVRRRLRVAALVVTAIALTACDGASTAPPRSVGEGDPSRGLEAIDRYGCASCHVIPGVRRAEASYVGPPLTRYGRRAYVAGVVPNSGENLARWIVDPQSINPRTAMPKLGVSETEARDIAAYLHSLQ